MESRRDPAASRLILPAFLIMSALSVASSDRISYKEVSDNYSKKPPDGFEEYMKKEYGEQKSNSCAIRLAFALEAVDSEFFKGFSSKATFKNKPVRAKELAAYLDSKLEKRTKVGRKDDLKGKKGIIYFGGLKDAGVGQHISIWTGSKVGDDRDLFDKANEVGFWPLP
jgi:hypothetical protein